MNNLQNHHQHLTSQGRRLTFISDPHTKLQYPQRKPPLHPCILHHSPILLPTSLHRKQAYLRKFHQFPHILLPKDPLHITLINPPPKHINPLRYILENLNGVCHCDIVVFKASEGGLSVGLDVGAD